MSVAENCRKFAWTTAKAEAAALVADDRLTDVQIAAKVGVTPRTFYYWKDHPAFMARVDIHIRRIDEAAGRRAIARKAARVQALHDRWVKMQQVIEDRAADPEMADARGGDTGLLVKQRRCVGGGDNAEFVDEFSVDTGLLKELREHEKQAAQEMGQWTERHEHRVNAHLFHQAARLAGDPAALDRLATPTLGPTAADWD